MRTVTSAWTESMYTILHSDDSMQRQEIFLIFYTYIVVAKRLTAQVALGREPGLLRKSGVAPGCGAGLREGAKARGEGGRREGEEAVRVTLLARLSRAIQLVELNQICASQGSGIRTLSSPSDIRLFWSSVRICGTA